MSQQTRLTVYRTLFAAALAAAAAEVDTTATGECTGPLDLVVLILSRPSLYGGTTDSQRAVRATWAHWKQPCAVRHWFVLGGAMRTYAQDDVLHVMAPEGYANITLKVLASMRWLLHGGPNRAHAAAGVLGAGAVAASSQHGSVDGDRQRRLTHGTTAHGHLFHYLLKTDDDSYVCMGGVMRLLAQHLPLYAGRASAERQISSRDKMGRRFDAKEPTYSDVFNRTGVYDYFQGAGYVLSAGLVEAVLENARRLGLGGGLSPSYPSTSSGSARKRQVGGTRPVPQPGSNEDAWIGAFAREASTGIPPLRLNPAPPLDPTAATPQPRRQQHAGAAWEAAGSSAARRGACASVICRAIEGAPERRELLHSVGVLPAVAAYRGAPLPLSEMPWEIEIPIAIGETSIQDVACNGEVLITHHLIRPGLMTLCSATTDAAPPPCVVDPGEGPGHFFNVRTRKMRIASNRTMRARPRCACGDDSSVRSARVRAER